MSFIFSHAWLLLFYAVSFRDYCLIICLSFCLSDCKSVHVVQEICSKDQRVYSWDDVEDKSSSEHNA